jgi:hypothetical protein
MIASFGRRELIAVLVPILGLSCMSQFPEKCVNSTECAGARVCYGGRCVSFGSNARVQPTRQSPQNAADTASRRTDTVSRCDAQYSGSSPSLRINEILADVPEGQLGDTNEDGQRDPYADEFIEITNRTEESIAIRNLTLKINQDRVNLGPSNNCLEGGETLVVFGGGNLTSFQSSVPSVRVVSPPSALRLSNSGATVALQWKQQSVDSMSYDTAPPESLTLENQHSGSNYVLHTDISNDKRFSPGKCPDGDKLKMSKCR